jgi:hypothetical protein
VTLILKPIQAHLLIARNSSLELNWKSKGGRPAWFQDAVYVAALVVEK